MTGIIFNIQHFCLQDGPGIRTTVFFKGCPLRCAWCHNPESYRAQPEWTRDEARCIHCGQCADGCPSGALELCGKTVSVAEIMEQLKRQRIFYGEEGGLTLSGGEPTAQPEFAIALARAAKAENISVCAETCGFCDFAVLKSLAEAADLFLYDLKLMDDTLHRQYTGVSNQRILENLRQLDELGNAIILRCPMIPGVNVNEAHLSAVAKLAGSLRHVQEIQLEPYHPLGLSKVAKLGIQPAYSEPKSLDRSILTELCAKVSSSIPITIQ